MASKSLHTWASALSLTWKLTLPLMRAISFGATLILFGLVASAIAPSRAHAYVWMVRHGYTTCATCHADPSGGGLLTQYGRAQGELLLRTQYAKKDQDDPGAAAKFLWGAIDLPDNVLLGGDFRSLAYDVMPKTGKSQTDLFLMQ